ncbi:inosine-uridine preferring nucleoside hydrolase [Colletotrichum eremochloae]|uniref:Putative inosine-uridine preferring nucleoside hydrolase n=1 Tax=Colletotrichum sublineola TaxID=1173701 RepID=A0A066X263_COLSU|nr:inosine-uridine preferring nucleoside hydrolase [Colletotrichum sublineola]KAK2020229.1 inosine-uridine preferring nucleoside hydrolase [Colletotrichum eremochloae]KDN61759.1 putative inosine-uridine preferring nucleoside hydrolase [Colletotrichum sublineola]
MVDLDLPETPVPVWLDCDPGHDDTFAILLAAYHPTIKLLGVSTVFGNAPLVKTTNNATSILTAIGKHNDVPVYVGAAKPMSRPPMEAATDIHGESGLDGTDLLPKASRDADRTVPAIDAMAAALKAQPAGAAWLVATGSLTNVALLFQKHPELVAHIKGLSIMGGAIGDGFTDIVLGVVDGVPRIGNWTPWAEFNIIIDPEAAASVFHNKALAAKTTLVTLDLSHQVLATEEVRDLLLYGKEGTAAAEKTGKGKTTLRQMLVELLMFFAKTYSDVFGITAGPPLHDPLAVAAVLGGTKHEIPFRDYNTKKGNCVKYHERFELTVVTEGDIEEAKAGRSQLGRTIARPLPPGSEGVRIPRGLDITMFWRVLEECTERADRVNAGEVAGLKQNGALEN